MFSLLDSFRAVIAGDALYLILAILAVTALTFIVYRRTNPIVRPAVRRTLAALRTLALLLIILALFALTLQFRQVETTPPLLAIAIDQSASMVQKDAGSSRAETIARLLHEDLPGHLDRDLAVEYTGFAAHTRVLPKSALDSLEFAGDATNITGALESIKNRLVEQNLAAILLFSDGNYTQGGDPGRYAAEIGIPVYTIGIGSARIQTEIGIGQVEANPFAFVGESTPVRVTVRSTSGKREKIRLSLAGVTGEATAAEVDLQNGPLDSAIVLHYTPVMEGRQKLQVMLTPAGEDANRANNRFTLYQDVLKSRSLIFILAGTLSPDLTFLRNHLRVDERFDIRLLTELGDGTGLQADRSRALQDSIEQGDLFVLYNFPRRTSSPQIVARLLSTLEKRPRPLLFISGRDPEWPRLKAFEPLLPIRADVLGTGEVEVLPILTTAGLQHPVMQSPGGSVTAWSLLPPVYARERLRAWWPDAEILANARPAGAASATAPGQMQWPFILVRNAGAKSAAILGYDLWRWHLMMTGIGNKDEIYHHFFQNLVRWLQIDRNSDLIRVRTAQATYHFGDEVQITAQVVDAQFRPVDDAEVAVTLVHGGSESVGGKETLSATSGHGLEKTLSLTPAGDGRYTGTFRPELAGDYQIKAEVRRDGLKVGEASHLFTVGSYNEELSDVALKETLLRRVASLSGGEYANADSAAALIDRIHGSGLRRTMTRDVEVWNRASLLAAILALLVLEWILRRRKGML
jgi:hypothetical protein